MSKFNQIILTSVSVASLTLAGGMSYAQESGGGDSQAETVFEEIIVTARKREESLLDTPTSISVFSGETLTRLNVSNLDDVAKYVPNLNINRFGVGNPSQAAIFIRGIGLQDHLIVTDPAVGVYLDGVYLGRQMGSNLSLQNIKRIEVLRGPQGTLYGRNSIGGAVNIITHQPGDEETVFLNVRGGTRERAEISAYGNFRLTDSIAVSLNGGFKRRGGVGRAVNIDNPSKEVGEELEINGRIAVKWEASETFRVTASFDGTDSEGGQSPFEIDILTPQELTDITGSPLPAGVEFFGTPLLTEADLVDRDDLATVIPSLVDVSNTSWGASLVLEWDNSDTVTTKLLASYREMTYSGGVDDDDTAFNLSHFPEIGGADQFSLELQINATFDNLDIVTGLYYFNEDGFTFSGPFTFAPFNLDGPGDFFNVTQKTNSYAGYLNGSYHLSEKLTFGAGVRYSRDEKDATSFFPGFPAPDAESANFDAITADASLTYKLADDMTVYAQIQRGYQTGGFPPRVFVGGPDAFEPFEKQTAINYEVGFKGDVAPFWRLAVSAFWTVYDDLALNVSVPQAGGFVTRVENAGKSRSRGVEIESQMVFTNGFFLNGSLGILDSEITEVTAQAISIVAGDEPALTPSLTASIVGGYRHQMDNGSNLSFQADYSYRDDMFGQPVNLEPERLDSRSLVGFNIEYEHFEGGWALSIYGENIFNEVYDQGRLINTFHGFTEVVLSNDRSEFGVRLTKRFNGF